MDVTSTVFAFDLGHLFKDGMERCFEMNRATTYSVGVKEQQACCMFWLFGDDTFPEMQLTIRKAKQNYSPSWPWDCTEGSVAELVLHNLALQKENQGICDENATLKDEINHLRQLQSGIARSVEAMSDGVMTSMPEVSMCTVCDESVSTYYNPVPGMNTILSCAAKKVQTNTEPTPTLTVNMRKKMEEIRQMFYEGDSAVQQQETLAMGTSAVALKSISSTCRPSVPVKAHKDAPTAFSPDHLGELRVRKDESSPLRLVQQEESLGLRIFKDPEGLAALEAEAKLPRQPLRAITHTSAARYPLPPPSSDEENLGFAAVKQEAADRIDPVGMTVSTLTLPLVFDPPCASTSVFTGGIVSSPPTSSPPNPDTRVQPKQPHQQVQEEDDMVVEMSSPLPSPTKPDSPLADAFNLFVHSPDPSGRLRIDATKFMDAFLAKKAAKTKGAENKRPPSFR